MSNDAKPVVPAKSEVEKKAELTEMTKKLEQVERTTGSGGAVPLTPKNQLLDARDMEQKNPEKRFRWVNVNNSEKMQARQAQGYERVAVSEGGRQVGNLALFSLDRKTYEERVRQNKELGERRLNAHKAEVEQMADAVARELRDRHGIKVDAERIIIRE